MSKKDDTDTSPSADALLNEIGHSVTLRNNFENAIIETVTAGIGARSLLSYEALTRDLLTALSKQSWVLTAGVVGLSRSDEPEAKVLPDDAVHMWEKALELLTTDRARDSIRSQQSLCTPLPAASPGAPGEAASVFLLSHCYGSVEPLSLFVVTHSEAGIVHSLVQSAAVWIGAIVGLAERTRARAEAAGMIAHLSASSIGMAQFLLDKALKGLSRNEEATESRNSIEQALGELNEARRALQRGQYWCSSPPKKQVSLNLSEELHAVANILNRIVGETGQPLISESHLESCRAALAGVVVSGSGRRLRQSLQDVAIGAWLLSGGKPLEVRCETVRDNDRGKSRVVLKGQGSIIPSNWSAKELEDCFFDPEVFQLSSKELGERALTFDVPQRLLAQMGAQLRPEVQNDAFLLSVDFDECSFSDDEA